MRWKPHVRFGGRARETDRQRRRHGALVRSHWATEALDVVRRWVWNTLRTVGLAGKAAHLKGCRYALWKNPEDLTDRQTAKLAWIARHNQQLYRAYLLNYPARGGGSRGGVGVGADREASEVAFERGDDALVAGDF